MSDEYDLGPSTSLDDVSAKLDDVVSELQDIKSALSNTDKGSGSVWEYTWAFIVFMLILGWSGSKPDRFTDRLWYSVRYDADWKNVNVEKRPTECNFLRSPIGSKGCSYKKEKSVFGEEDRRVLISQATTDEEKQEIRKRPNSVVVYWQKKDEP